MTRSIGLSAAFVVLAVILFAVAILYWMGSLNVLASSIGPHHKHAAVAAGLGLVSLVAASFSRPQTATS